MGGKVKLKEHETVHAKVHTERAVQSACTFTISFVVNPCSTNLPFPLSMLCIVAFTHPPSLADAPGVIDWIPSLRASDSL